MGWKWSSGSHKAAHDAGGVLFVLLGFLFPLEKLEAETAVEHCAGLGEGQCHQHVITSLSLLMQSVLGVVVQRVAGWCFSHMV